MNIFALLDDETIPTAQLVRSVKRRLPGVSVETLLKFSEVVHSVAEGRGNNTHQAHKDFIRLVHKADKNGEPWATEAIKYGKIARPVRRTRRPAPTPVAA